MGTKKINEYGGAIGVRRGQVMAGLDDGIRYAQGNNPWAGAEALRERGESRVPMAFSLTQRPVPVRREISASMPSRLATPVTSGFRHPWLNRARMPATQGGERCGTDATITGHTQLTCPWADDDVIHPTPVENAFPRPAWSCGRDDPI